MLVGTAVGPVAGIASMLLVTATIRPDVVIALVVGVPSAIGLLRVRARSVTLTDRQSGVIRSVGHRTEGKSGSTPVVAHYGCDSVRPKELIAKYGRPPLGDNIPPFADTVNVTAVLI
jgi:hypothetical protein